MPGENWTAVYLETGGGNLGTDKFALFFHELRKRQEIADQLRMSLEMVRRYINGLLSMVSKAAWGLLIK